MSRLPSAALGSLAAAMQNSWERVIAPSPALADVGDARRARLLASMLALLIPAGLASGIAQELVIPGFAHTFVVILIALAMLALAYLASRTRHYRVGGVIACLAPIVACAVTGLSHPGDRVWWGFMELGVLLATIFLSTAWAAAIGLLALCAVLAVVASVPEYQSSSTWLPPLMFQAVFSPLLVLGGHYRGRIERERHEALRMLEASRRLETIGRLAGGIAHDFNNVLMVIGGNADLLARKLADGSHELADIRDATERAQSLTRQLLTYARKQELTPRRVELDHLVTGMQRFLARLIGDVSLRLEVGASGSTVLADVSQLEQVLVNLAINARDAMPRGGTLTIRTTSVDIATEGGEVPAGRYVVLTVEDTGVGMTADVRERAFDPFFSTKGPEGGTGLGLATVHAVVAQAGGRITLRSQPGKGTTFAVYLPHLDTRVSLAPAELVADQSRI